MTIDSIKSAGRLIGIDIPDVVLSDETKFHLEQYGFGGVCLFHKNIQTRSQVTQLIHAIREVLPHAWISIDQEGGAVLRTHDLPFAPSAMALGATADAGLAQAVGAATGRGLRSLGINWNYAPSLDVNVDPRNPVIGERSFGSSPSKVAELGLAWAKGLQSAGVAATVKHFPGHGDTYLDSHLSLPKVDKPLEQLEAIELSPFRQAVQAGVASIMTAHILYPALDPHHPATLSQAILTGLLRQKWRFEGVIVTDSMAMKAIADNYPAGGAAVASVQAGADIVLALGRFETQIAQVEALAKAIEAGQLSRQRLEASYRRIEHLLRQFPNSQEPYSSELEAADYALMQQAARQSITAVGQVRLPKPGDRILLLIADTAMGEHIYETSPNAQALCAALGKHFSQLEVLAFPHGDPLASTLALEQAAQHADFLLYASTSRRNLNPAEIELAQKVVALNKPALHLALWNPYYIRQIPLPALVAYGFRPPTLQALAEAIAGQTPRGQLPFKL